MSELRFNLIAREWVVIPSERAKKPEHFRRKERRYRPEFLESCPFCPGNEEKTPEEITRRPSGVGPWRVRVTPNKYATLSAEGEFKRVNERLRHQVSGVGRHEVIVESPRHDMSLALLGRDAVGDVLSVYRERFLASFGDARVRHVIIFKNHGPAAGTTILHPHSQLIATPVVPIQVRNRVDEAMRYFDHTGECLTCAMLAEELKDGSRVLMDTGHFVSFVPYAALSPFHIWVFPKAHRPSFANVTDEELGDLASNLNATLRMLHFGLDDPDYNLVVRSLSPFRGRSEYIHWHITIVPQVVGLTGFELGSGMHVNATVPEESAAYLRGAKVPVSP